MTTSLFQWLRQRFSMAHDMATPADIQAEVEDGIAFGSTNLWVLVFAILVASVGLNVNSTAVVIGAMLISPLMGPIVGIGYGAATMEVGLIQRGMKSLLRAAGIGLFVSALYFFLTPLSDAGSELLSRTVPTTWDVFIALAGGAAGAVSLTRCERGNVIPGVAIATALMPPLCTAGYGLATGHWGYLFGAAYLFCINCVFITLATFLVVRILPIPRHQFATKRHSRRVRLSIWLVAVLTAGPSVYLAAGIVQRTTFDHNAQQFIDEQLNLPGAFVLTKRLDAKQNSINVLLAGRRLTPAQLAAVRSELPRYNLSKAQLTVRQGVGQLDTADARTFRSSLLADVRTHNAQTLAGYNSRLTRLQQLLALSADSTDADLPAAPALLREVQVEHPTVRQLALSRLIHPAADSLRADTTLVVAVRTRPALPKPEQQRLTKWLHLRTGERWPVRLLTE